MFARLAGSIALLCLAAVAQGQNSAPPRYQLYGGYTFLSNTLNGVSGSHQPMNGAEIAFAIPPWHNLRFKVSGYAYDGTNLGASEHPYFIMGGAQFGRTFGKEEVFVEGLGGEGGVNANWGAKQAVGDTASFAAILGGGVDTPISPRFAFRVQGDLQYSYFKVEATRNPTTGVPIYVPGLPVFFGRITSGIVWRF